MPARAGGPPRSPTRPAAPRRGRYQAVVPRQIPPAYPPQWIRRPDRRFARTRRAMQLPMYLLGLAPPAFVPITIGLDGGTILTFTLRQTRPLTYLTFWLNYAIGGGDPILYHAVNLALQLRAMAPLVSRMDVVRALIAA